jgi:hypothetical protein
VKKRSGLLGLVTNNKAPPNSNISKCDKEDFSDLPPNQRRKKLQQKIDELNAKVCQETAARDGLMKMKQVYESNAALGDPMSIQGQLAENGHKLDKLRAELKKFQCFLDEMDGRISNSPGNTLQTSASTASKGDSNGRKKRPGRRSSVSDGAESLSRSASDSSVSNPTVNHNKNNMSTPLHGHGSSNSPESGIGLSSQSIPSSDNKSELDGREDDDDDDEEEEFYDSEPLPILGRCRALYTFEVTSEGSIRMEENEDLWVIEKDQGDGWTRVRRTNITTLDPMPEGFVPSSYIEVYELFSAPQPV